MSRFVIRLQEDLTRPSSSVGSSVPSLPELSMGRRFLMVVAALLGLALGLGACGGAPPSAGPATPVASGVLPIQALEYDFTPAEISVPAGVVHFAVSNGGDLDHEFELMSGDASLGKIEAFSRGTTKDLTVTLEPGSYTFVCRLNGHDQLGMKGTLTVTGS